MFARIAALATFAIPLVSALTLNTPTGVAVGGLVNVTWEATTSDPSSFSLYMVNTIFHNTFAIGNNVQSSAGIITLTLPQVPVGDGYTLEATSNSNINTVYAQSGDFAVSAMSSATLPSTSTTSTSSSTGTGLSTASIVAPTTTAPATTAQTSSSASASPSTINSSGAASLIKIGMGPAAVVLLSAAAGAAIMF
ncbi:uncharacterized protein F5891DRAFT_1127590 [Suillus fuscotomentosus]|uniref:Yeast cell wall synthesis Kre9/Knh1-like N-terminal domain-containing protein n=1 Tax=Suillus fuscotomentosus TaxID=1912939 RepID=A0AAD4EAG4_9AGAM|nr:uncharacterized protein F5891DRAFT_1127590 [Suillus fuscotomentosus]KAG1902649.1 hypothetical protein F5891DRAFT_1127590 [Suillus fuscotomentosus]